MDFFYGNFTNDSVNWMLDDRKFEWYIMIDYIQYLFGSVVNFQWLHTDQMYSVEKDSRYGCRLFEQISDCQSGANVCQSSNPLANIYLVSNLTNHSIMPHSYRRKAFWMISYPDTSQFPRFFCLQHVLLIVKEDSATSEGGPVWIWIIWDDRWISQCCPPRSRHFTRHMLTVGTWLSEREDFCWVFVGKHGGKRRVSVELWFLDDFWLDSPVHKIITIE